MEGAITITNPQRGKSTYEQLGLLITTLCGKSFRHIHLLIFRQDHFIPEDELEQDYLDLQHETYLYMSHGKLYSALLKDDVKDVLEIGTGTGILAIDFADDHPSAQVLGTGSQPQA